MNVMYLCDDNYVMAMGVSVISLLDHNKDVDVINIFWVVDQVSNSNIDKVRKCVELYNRNLFVIEKPDIKEILKCEVTMHRWGDNVFSKVLLNEVFKDYPKIEKLIYIDCDTLIVGSLQDLWNLDLGNEIGAGVCEAMGNLHKKAIGLSKEDNYFNSGMFLVDLVKWKKAGIDTEAVNFIKRQKGKVEYPDEAILNGVVSRKLKKISPKYNLTSLSIYYTTNELKIYRKSYVNYSENERQEALADARVIHFTSTFLDVRPWMKGCRHPYTDKWLEYKAKSLWPDVPLMKDGRSIKKRLARKLVLMLPKPIRLQVTGLIHAYIKPLRYVW